MLDKPYNKFGEHIETNRRTLYWHVKLFSHVKIKNINVVIKIEPFLKVFYKDPAYIGGYVVTLHDNYVYSDKPSKVLYKSLRCFFHHLK